MNDARPIQATLSDFKLVKTRKCAQFVFEIPLEQADDALRSLGGLPQAQSERWCAIVLLDLSKAPEPAPAAQKERRRMEDLPIVNQAGILCNDPVFWAFLTERYKLDIDNADNAAVWLREWCGVASRRELATAPNAAAIFHELRAEFDVWRQCAI